MIDKSKLIRLWDAANCHSAITLGEFIIDCAPNDDTGVPECPEDLEHVLDLVSEYLESST